MTNRKDSVWISLQLADGRFYPLFRYGDSGPRSLTLLPARENQQEVDINFFLHSFESLQPLQLGTIIFREITAEENTELLLDAKVEEKGKLSVKVTNTAGGQSESLELNMKNEENLSDKKHRNIFRFFFGLIFILASIGLVYLAIKKVTDWGKQAPSPAPISRLGQPSGQKII